MKKNPGFLYRKYCKVIAYKSESKTAYNNMNAPLSIFLKLSTQQPNLQYKESYFYIEKMQSYFIHLHLDENIPKFFNFPRQNHNAAIAICIHLVIHVTGSKCTMAIHMFNFLTLNIQGKDK